MLRNTFGKGSLPSVAARGSRSHPGVQSASFELLCDGMGGGSWCWVTSCLAAARGAAGGAGSHIEMLFLARPGHCVKVTVTF